MNKKELKTYTKIVVKWMLIIGVINSEIPYILSALGKDSCISLGISWITEIIAVILGYLIKSFLGKKEEENLKFERDKISATNDPSSTGDVADG